MRHLHSPQKKLLRLTEGTRPPHPESAIIIEQCRIDLTFGYVSQVRSHTRVISLTQFFSRRHGEVTMNNILIREQKGTEGKGRDGKDEREDRSEMRTRGDACSHVMGQGRGEELMSDRGGLE